MSFLRQSHNVKPERWGSDADVQFAVAKNSEKIYGIDHKSNVLVMPLFFGFPCLDFSGKQNHGTPYGGVAYDGQGLILDGTNDYVDVGTNSSLQISTGDFSISSWIKTDLSHTGVIFAKGDVDQAPYIGYQVYTRTTDPYIRIYTIEGVNNTSQTTSQPQNIHDGLKHYIVAQRNSGNLQIYVDGIIKSNESLTLRDVSNTQTAFIGRRLSNNLNSLPFNGLIDEARISNVARTAQWIATEYNNQSDVASFLTIGAEECLSVPATRSGGENVKTRIKGGVIFKGGVRF